MCNEKCRIENIRSALRAEEERIQQLLAAIENNDASAEFLAGIARDIADRLRRLPAAA